MQHKQNGGLQNLSLSEIHSRETSPPMKSPPLAAANRGKASHLMTASQPKPQKLLPSASRKTVNPTNTKVNQSQLV